LDLRASSPAAERRTRSRSLRGPILARPAPSCAHDDDRLRIPPASPAHNSTAGKKESTGRRPSPPCQPCAKPSSNLSPGYHRNDAHTAENGFATTSSMSKSAKVVLIPLKPIGILGLSAQPPAPAPTRRTPRRIAKRRITKGRPLPGRP